MGRSPESWVHKRLRIKYFHGVSSGNQHPYLLKSRYGKVRIECCVKRRGRGEEGRCRHSGNSTVQSSKPVWHSKRSKGSKRSMNSPVPMESIHADRPLETSSPKGDARDFLGTSGEARAGPGGVASAVIPTNRAAQGRVGLAEKNSW